MDILVWGNIVLSSESVSVFHLETYFSLFGFHTEEDFTNINSAEFAAKFVQSELNINTVHA